MPRRLILALLLATSAPAFAAPDAATLFAQGRNAEAIKAGIAENSSAGLLAAGRAQLQIAAYETTDRAQAKAQVNAALGHFEAALAKDPANRAAQLQKAIAIGYVAKLDRSPGGAKAMRRQLEAMLAQKPNDAQVLAALGGWNGGAVATLGGFVARTVLGASAAAMDKDFARAMSLDPTNPVHPVFYALTLLDIDADNAARAKQLLERAAGLKAADAFERQLQLSGAKVLAQLNTGDARAAQKLARQLLPFGTVR